MSKRLKGREVDGIILLNKPTGMSSNGALQKVKRLYQANKAGHTGSLDNLASGLLPLCFGEATKLSQFLLNADKVYQVVGILGTMTTTGDAEGEILYTNPVENIDLKKIQSVIQPFIGEITQIPPMYSALKHQGQPLYKLARKGIEIERQARHITIIAITIKELVDNRLSLEVHCSKGTYIRTLMEDIGKSLGCGAYISYLHRISVGPYQDMVDLKILEDSAQDGLTALDKWLMPIPSAFPHLPAVILSEEASEQIQQGKSVPFPPDQNQLIDPEHFIKLFMKDETHFLGIGHVLEDGRLNLKRMIKWTKPSSP